MKGNGEEKKGGRFHGRKMERLVVYIAMCVKEKVHIAHETRKSRRAVRRTLGNVQGRSRHASFGIQGIFEGGSFAPLQTMDDILVSGWATANSKCRYLPTGYGGSLTRRTTGPSWYSASPDTKAATPCSLFPCNIAREEIRLCRDHARFIFPCPVHLTPSPHHLCSFPLSCFSSHSSPSLNLASPFFHLSISLMLRHIWMDNHLSCSASLMMQPRQSGIHFPNT